MENSVRWQHPSHIRNPALCTEHGESGQHLQRNEALAGGDDGRLYRHECHDWHYDGHQYVPAEQGSLEVCREQGDTDRCNFFRLFSWSACG